jgi:hypothetical protein
LQGNDVRFGAGTGAFVMTGGELRGAGAIGFPLNQTGGRLGVGRDVGSTTSITGNYTLGSAGTMEIQSLVLNQGAVYDRLTVSGDVILGGTLALAGDFGTDTTALLMILENQGTNLITGNFLGLPEGATFNAAGSQFRITYQGGTGNDVVLTVVPEPGTLGMVTLGLAGLVARRSRRRATA